MVNNSTNINQTNNYISWLLLTEHNKNHDIYNGGNPGTGLGQAHTSGGVKSTNGIPTFPRDNWVSNDNTYINENAKPAQSPLY